MPTLGSSTTFPSVPRANSRSDVLKRCAARAREMWEAQKTEAMKKERLVHKGNEFASEIAEHVGEQWKFQDKEPETPESYRQFMENWQKKHGWMREDQEPYDPEAGKYQGPHEGAKVLTGAELRARAAAMGGSSMSWTTADPPIDASNAERNANRQQAPVGWEADGGQERTAVMGILGGRKR